MFNYPTSNGNSYKSPMKNLINPFRREREREREIVISFSANSFLLCLSVLLTVNMSDITKRLMSSPKCRSVEPINNPARPGSNHMEVNYINYK